MAEPAWKAILNKRKAQKDANEVKATSLGMGKTTLRVLPNPKNPDDPFYMDYGEHWIKSPTEKNAQGKPKIVGVAVCASKAYEQPCVYCEAISTAERHMEDNAHDFSDFDKELINGARSRHRILINAAVRTNSGDYEIKLIDLASTAFNQLIDLIAEYGAEVVNAKGGLDVVFNRTGQGINTSYTAMPARDHGSDIADGWEEKCIDIKSYAESRQLNSERQNIAIATVGQTAQLSVATMAALPSAASGASSNNPALASKYAPSDDDLDDDLDSELDGIPLDEAPTPTPTPAPAQKQEESIIDAELVDDDEPEQADDDLLSELDELDNL